MTSHNNYNNNSNNDAHGQHRQPIKMIAIKGTPTFLSAESYALVLIAICSMFYAAMGAFVKLATTRGIPSTELVFIRAIFQGSLAFLAMAMTGYHENPTEAHNITTTTTTTTASPSTTAIITEQQLQPASSVQRRLAPLVQVPLGSASIRPIVLARGACGGCGFVLYFYTISVLPLGDAVALLSLSPVVTVWASAAILGEPFYKLHIVAAMLTVLGSFCIAQPAFLFGTTLDHNTGESSLQDKHHNSFGYVTAAMGTCTGAGVFLLIRKAGKSGAHTLQLLFSWACFGFLFSIVLGVIIPLGKGGWVVPTSPTTWAYIGGCCILGAIAHFLLNFAGRHSNPGLTSIVRSSGILWAYLLQIWLFDQVPTLLTCLGVLLVSASLIMVSIQKLWDSTNQKTTTTTKGDAAATSSKMNDETTTHEQQNVEEESLLSMDPQMVYGTTESMEVRALSND